MKKRNVAILYFSSLIMNNKCSDFSDYLTDRDSNKLPSFNHSARIKPKAKPKTENPTYQNSTSWNPTKSFSITFSRELRFKT